MAAENPKNLPPWDPPEYFVGIGASAGGLKAIEDFFKTFPLDTDISFAVIQHLSPDFKSLMDEILSRYTQLKIVRVEDGVRIEKNTIYLIPPTQNMIVSNKKLLLSRREKVSSVNLNLPIDLFFRSLAQDFGKKAIGVLLSGSGSDGARGVVSISEGQGLVLAQTEESAKFASMPTSAIATGAVDEVLNPKDMVAVILKHTGYLSESTSDSVNAEEQTAIGIDDPILKIFERLRRAYGVNFNYYRPTTIERRLERRMSITGCIAVDEYLHVLEGNNDELDLLYQDLLIGVTQFFRDPQAFSFLENEVIPQLFDHQSKDIQTVRIWTPGCATGEEAYSLAILFSEYMKKHKIKAEVKIFATDIHKESLVTASQGVYSEESLASMTDDRISVNFIRGSDGTYAVRRQIRKMIVFAPQNVLSDPPFTNLDLVVCRNLLIYFEPSIQEKVITLFHFALKLDKFMFLGPSESIGRQKNDFKFLSREWKILKKRRDAAIAPGRPLAPAVSVGGTKIRRETPVLTARSTNFRLNETLSWAYESLLSKFVGTGFLVDESGEVLHFFGDAHHFLKPLRGRPTTNLIKMVNDQLAQAISAAMSRSLRENVKVVYKGIRTKLNESDELDTVHLETEPLKNKRANSLFLFISLNVVDRSPVFTPEDRVDQYPSITGDRVSDLETELQFTQESLQAANEELETTNEELQATNEELVASNEELQSTNEELQSTNEELQSTNEELHSVNEELQTVNVEYQGKIEELAQLTNDMENLLNSTEIGTIFLSKELTIRKYTPALSSTIHILPRDIGRPFDHISNKMHIGNSIDLHKTIQKVLDEKEPITKEVSLSDNLWMLMRILPYYDESSSVQGIVLTFIDITALKISQIQLRNYATKLEARNQDLQDFSFIASHDLKAPLRQVKNYAYQLGESHSFTESQKESYDGMQVGLKKMESLITDLLEFSRVHSRGKEFQQTDCSQVLGEVLESYKDQFEELGAKVTCSLLPKLKVDKAQLVQVFQNLIDNSLKFRGDRPLRIEVSAVNEKNQWIFVVKDNGIGVPSTMLEEILIIFRVAHGDRSIEGNGLGLAICRRIIERHGGRLWVESKEGEGCQVQFTLPV